MPGERSPPGSAWAQGTETATVGESASLRGFSFSASSQQEDGLNDLLFSLSYIAIISMIVILHFVTSLQWNTATEKMCTAASASQR